MHKVDVWLANHGRNRVWLAEKIGTSTATLSRAITGQLWPGREFFRRLKKITGIGPDDFLEPVPAAARPRAAAAAVRQHRRRAA